jgi:hypothetical protein
MTCNRRRYGLFRTYRLYSRDSAFWVTPSALVVRGRSRGSLFLALDWRWSMFILDF